MKIISYNVNGIRAAMKKGLLDWLKSTDADVFCVQETKAVEEQVDLAKIEELGYHHYWNSAIKRGYSGVAIFSKKKPLSVVRGTGFDAMDGEGRVIRADFEDFSIISLYVPSGTNVNRLDFKMEFCYEFSKYIQNLRKEIPHLIICGDYNICHHAIDIHDPVRLQHVSGFLPMEREWLSHFIESCEMLDSFRELSDEPHQYTWWSYRANARNNNKGWRIDYHMISKGLKNRLERSLILPEVRHSNHCPILLELK